MSRLYDAAEPGVIDEDLLRQLVVEQGPEKEAGRIARVEGIEFTEVLEIRLDFKNIQQIENLWQFTNLTKLQLDNNIIGEIKGLERLVHLQWLDLSFNNIKEINGLESLVNLKDLTLAHNLIQHVGGLESLDKLQVLSLGYNALTDLKDTVLYIRQMPSLSTLCLKGNGFSPVPPHDEEKGEAETFRMYHTVCLAYLPDLVYLDYQMIMMEERNTACEEHQDDLAELVRNEKQKMAKAKEQKEHDERLQLLHSAYMDGLDGKEFFNDLIKEDPEEKKTAEFPDEQKRLEQFEKDVMEISQGILEIGLGEKDKRVQEREAFFTAHRRAMDGNQRQSVEKVEKYEQEKASLLKDNHFEKLGEEITELRYELMKLEMILVEQLDEMIKDFDRSYNELIGGCLEKIQAQTTQLRDLEKQRHEKATEEANSLASRTDIEDAKLIKALSDKDSLLGFINSVHDSHMLAIDNKEDGIRIGMQKDSKVLIDGLIDQELARNRQRVMEIKHYIELQEEELEDWLNSGN